MSGFSVNLDESFYIYPLVTFIRPNGAAEALDLAKQQGEVRMKPFSGKGEQLQKGLLTLDFATSSLLGRERRLRTDVSQLF